jgi:hypothetical protein
MPGGENTRLVDGCLEKTYDTSLHHQTSLPMPAASLLALVAGITRHASKPPVVDWHVPPLIPGMPTTHTARLQAARTGG